MPETDYAILVGIAKYADSKTFSELQGPPNDVALMTEWLTDPDGGNVNPDNIKTILSPSVIPPGTDPDLHPPVTDDFKRAFKNLVRDSTGNFLKRQGRLYLYFSGHGFCEKKSLTPQATLYAANATRAFPENIYGTNYALRARDNALFSEIVLIMDSCRDAEVNRPFDVPPINEAGSDEAANVKLLCIYAAPKGGKAQERIIADRGNRVYGLLTHGLITSLTVARPGPDLNVTGSALKDHLLGTWETLCGPTPAPRPEIVLPTGDDIRFRSQGLGVNQEFELADYAATPIKLEVLDSKKKSVVRCELQPPPLRSTVSSNGSGPNTLAFDGTTFSLPLQPNFYQYVLTGGLDRKGLFAVELQGGPIVRL